ncbi:hypothetical protein EV426DRAFT_570219 [Tirmania nivea]|nr:hypothetical protein EV426DRAFT_570219 [Tirmania nivea]
MSNPLPSDFYVTKAGTIATVIAALRRHAEIVQPEVPSNPTGGAGGSTVTRGLFTGKNGPRKFNNKRFGSGSSGKKYICWYCAKPGHRQQNCFLKEKATKLTKGKGPREINAIDT